MQMSKVKGKGKVQYLP